MHGATGNRNGTRLTNNFSFDYHVPYTFWAGVLGGAFLNTASHGVDQLILHGRAEGFVLLRRKLSLKCVGPDRPQGNPEPGQDRAQEYKQSWHCVRDFVSC